LNELNLEDGIMKKLLALVLAVVMMLGTVALAETVAAPSSLDAVVTAGVLKVGVDAAFAPMTSQDAEGNFVGFDIELATAVAAKLGVAVEFVAIDYSTENMVAALADGTIDCVWSGMSINADRKAAMTVSAAYLPSDTVILVPADVAAFVEDLEGKTVAVQGGSLSVEILKEIVAEDAIVVCASSDEAIAAAIKMAEINAAEKAAKDAGEKYDKAAATEGLVLADAVILDSIYAAYQLTNNEALAGFTTIEGLYADMFGIGFAKGDYLLCGAVEEAIFELADEGVVAEIAEKWFGTDATLIK
jgi:polar amino acid transport system substrate-binding protein